MKPLLLLYCIDERHKLISNLLYYYGLGQSNFSISGAMFREPAYLFVPIIISMQKNCYKPTSGDGKLK